MHPATRDPSPYPRTPVRFAFLLTVPFLLPVPAAAQSYQVGRIRTELGEIRFLLSDRTPRHKASFLRLAAAHYWDSLTFNRVIPNFVAQGGCPDTPAGFGAFPNLLAPELHDSLRHVYGAVGAGRDGNADKVDPGCQFYIVANPKGLARLDGNYTVFGQVFEGMDVVERIVAAPRDSADAPLTPIHLTVDVITMTAEELRRAGAVLPGGARPE